MTAEIHVGNTTLFRLTMLKEDGSVLPVDGATTKNIIFKRPAGTTFTKALTFETNGTDGVLIYTTETTDLDTAGQWKLQVQLTIGVNQYKSTIKTFRVHANL